MSDSIRKQKYNKDSKLQCFCAGFTSFCQSKYTSFNIPKYKRSFFTKFRFSSHNLHVVIETQADTKGLKFQEMIEYVIKSAQNLNF